MHADKNTDSEKARLVGFNHVALEVGDIEEALSFYGKLFKFSLRGRGTRMAFIDLGDQFIALSEGRKQEPDNDRHFGLVVDDKEKVRRRLKEIGCKQLPGRSVEFRDPWGNRVQIVEYANIQFTKDAAVLEGMACGDLKKSREAIRELARKGMAPLPSKTARLDSAKSDSATEHEQEISPGIRMSRFGVPDRANMSSDKGPSRKARARK
ncbi:MAG: VOC family protein [Candidatus Binataceae bacterium]